MSTHNIVLDVQVRGPFGLNAVVQQLQNTLRGSAGVVDVRVSPDAARSVGALTDAMSGVSTSAGAAHTAATTAGSALTNMASSAKTAGAAVSSVSGSTSGAANALTQVRAAAAATGTTLEQMGALVGLAARRFTAFSLAAGAMISTLRGIKEATSQAFDFDKTLVKINQISTETPDKLKAISDEVTRVSTSLGVPSAKLINVAEQLKQAGLSINEVVTAIEPLGKASLAPSFGDIVSTTQGAIAVMRQFKLESNQLGEALGSINAVAANYAVEASDIIEATKRAGGAFAALGGNLHEFQALFTAVRATTRESAEAIATGLRTVFTRLQRPEVVQSLKDIGVGLRYTIDEADALGNSSLAGQAVPIFEAIQRISAGLAGLRSTDPRYAEVEEQLGGLRNISRVIPLIQQAKLAQDALNASRTGAVSLDIAAEKGQASLLNQVDKVKEGYFELFRSFSQTEGFRSLVTGALDFASALGRIFEFAKPLIPLLTALATVKLFQNIGSITSAVTGAFTTGKTSVLAAAKSQGGPVGLPAFEKGGVIPGPAGAAVPILAHGGEFMLRRQAAQEIGYDNLHRANGGLVRLAGGGRGYMSGQAHESIQTVQGLLESIGVNLPLNQLLSSYAVEEYRYPSRPKDAISADFFGNRHQRIGDDLLEYSAGRLTGDIPQGDRPVNIFPLLQAAGYQLARKTLLGDGEARQFGPALRSIIPFDTEERLASLHDLPAPPDESRNVHIAIADSFPTLLGKMYEGNIRAARPRNQGAAQLQQGLLNRIQLPHDISGNALEESHILFDYLREANEGVPLKPGAALEDYFQTNSALGAFYKIAKSPKGDYKYQRFASGGLPLLPPDSRASLSGLLSQIGGRFASDYRFSPTGEEYARILAEMSLPPEVLARIPEGSEYIGSGVAGVALRSPEGTVFRAQHDRVQSLAESYFSAKRGPTRFEPYLFKTDRPNIPGVLQPLGSERVGDVFLENLPFAPDIRNLSKNQQKEVAGRLRRLIARSGYLLGEDAHGGNIGTYQGSHLVIDPGTLKSAADLGVSVADYYGRTTPPDIEEGVKPRESRTEPWGRFATGGLADPQDFLSSALRSLYQKTGVDFGAQATGVHFVDADVLSQLRKPRSENSLQKGMFVPSRQRVLVNSSYSPEAMTSTLIHELTHSLDWRGGQDVLPGVPPGFESAEPFGPLAELSEAFRAQVARPRGLDDYHHLPHESLAFGVQSLLTGWPFAQHPWENLGAMRDTLPSVLGRLGEIGALPEAPVLGVTGKLEQLLGRRYQARFADGGVVPGVGDLDSVRMDLPAGSFVIKKSSALRAGHGTLSRLARLAGEGGGQGGAIPALVTPGEFIFDPAQTARLGGAALHRLNVTGDTSHLRGFATGGPVRLATGDYVVPGSTPSATDITARIGSLAVQQDVRLLASLQAAAAAAEIKFNTLSKVIYSVTDAGEVLIKGFQRVKLKQTEAEAPEQRQTASYGGKKKPDPLAGLQEDVLSPEQIRREKELREAADKGQVEPRKSGAQRKPLLPFTEYQNKLQTEHNEGIENAVSALVNLPSYRVGKRDPREVADSAKHRAITALGNSPEEAEKVLRAFAYSPTATDRAATLAPHQELTGDEFIAKTIIPYIRAKVRSNLGPNSSKTVSLDATREGKEGGEIGGAASVAEDDQKLSNAASRITKKTSGDFFSRFKDKQERQQARERATAAGPEVLSQLETFAALPYDLSRQFTKDALGLDIKGAAGRQPSKEEQARVVLAHLVQNPQAAGLTPPLNAQLQNLLQTADTPGEPDIFSAFSGSSKRKPKSFLDEEAEKTQKRAEAAYRKTRQAEDRARKKQGLPPLGVPFEVKEPTEPPKGGPPDPVAQETPTKPEPDTRIRKGILVDGVLTDVTREDNSALQRLKEKEFQRFITRKRSGQDFDQDVTTFHAQKKEEATTNELISSALAQVRQVEARRKRNVFGTGISLDSLLPPKQPPPLPESFLRSLLEPPLGDKPLVPPFGGPLSSTLPNFFQVASRQPILATRLKDFATSVGAGYNTETGEDISRLRPPPLPNAYGPPSSLQPSVFRGPEAPVEDIGKTVSTTPVPLAPKSAEELAEIRRLRVLGLLKQLRTSNPDTQLYDTSTGEALNLTRPPPLPAPEPRLPSPLPPPLPPPEPERLPPPVPVRSATPADRRAIAVDKALTGLNASDAADVHKDITNNYLLDSINKATRGGRIAVSNATVFGVRNEKGQIVEEGLTDKANALATKDLLAAIQRQVQGLNRGISSTEARRLAEEQLAEAMANGTRILRTGKGDPLGTESNARLLAEQDRRVDGRGALGGFLSDTSSTVGKATGTVTRPVGRFLGDLAHGTNDFLTNYSPRGSSLAFQLAAPYVAEGVSHLGGTAENAVATGKEGRFEVAQGIAGTIQSAVIGSVIGASVSGPFAALGAVIGATVGGLYGFYAALRDASKSLREAKIAESIAVFSDKIQTIGLSGDRTSPEILSSALENLQEYRKETSEKNIKEATSLLGNFDVASYGKLQSKSVRGDLGGQLGQFTGTLQKQASQILERGPETKSDVVLTQLKEGGAGLNRELFRLIADIRKLPISTIDAEFKKTIEEMRRSQTSLLAQDRARQGEERNVGAFTRLLLSLQGASDGLAGLRQEAGALQDLFNGQLGTTHVDFSPQNLQQLGRKDRGVEETVNVLRSTGGDDGTALADAVVTANKVQSVLPTILQEVAAKTNGTKLGAVDDFTTAVEKALRARLGETPQALAAISTVKRGIFESSKAQGEPSFSGIAKEIGIDASKFSEKLIAAYSGPAKEKGEKAVQEIQSSTNRYLDALTQFNQNLLKLAEQTDQLHTIQLSSRLGQAEIAAERGGYRRDSLRDISLEELQRPAQLRLERLTGLAGEEARNPTLIGKRVDTTDQNILRLTREKEDIAQDPTKGPKSPEFKEAANALIDLKRQSVTLRQALGDLSNAALFNASVEKKLGAIRADKEGRLSFAGSYLGADLEGRAQIDRGLAIAGSLYKGKGSTLDGLVPADQKLVLDVLASAPPQTRATGFQGSPLFGDVRQEFLQNSLGGQLGLDQGKKVEEKGLQDQLIEGFKRSEEAKTETIRALENENTKFFTNLTAQQAKFFNDLSVFFKQDVITKKEVQRDNVFNSQTKLATQGEQAKLLETIGIKPGESAESKLATDEQLANLQAKSKDLLGFQKALTARERLGDSYRSLSTNIRDELKDKEGLFSNGLILPQNIEKTKTFLTENNLSPDQQSRVLKNYDKEAQKRLDADPSSKVPENKELRAEIRSQALQAALREELLSGKKGTSLGLANEEIEKSRKQLKRIPGLDIDAIEQTIKGGKFEELNKAINAFGPDNKLSSLSGKINETTSALSALNKEIDKLKDLLPKKEETPEEKFTGTVSKAAGFFDNPFAPAEFARGGRVPRFLARGGDTATHPGGPRGTDTIPAWLTPGEYVVPAQAAAANLPILEKMRSGGLVYLAEGGLTRKKIIQDLRNSPFERTEGVSDDELWEYYRSQQRRAGVKEASGKRFAESERLLKRSPAPLQERISRLNERIHKVAGDDDNGPFADNNDSPLDADSVREVQRLRGVQNRLINRARRRDRPDDGGFALEASLNPLGGSGIQARRAIYNALASRKVDREATPYSGRLREKYIPLSPLYEEEGKEDGFVGPGERVEIDLSAANEGRRKIFEQRQADLAEKAAAYRLRRKAKLAGQIEGRIALENFQGEIGNLAFRQAQAQRGAGPLAAFGLGRADSGQANLAENAARKNAEADAQAARLDPLQNLLRRQLNPSPLRAQFDPQVFEQPAEPVAPEKPPEDGGWVNLLRRRGGFARGGIVPRYLSLGGMPGRDSVPALLEPGEMVLPKGFVHMAQGGVVGGLNLSGLSGATELGLSQEVVAAFRLFGANTESLGGAFHSFGDSATALSRSLDGFATTANRLSEALAKFPEQITMTGQQTITVQIAGAEALASISSEIKELVTAKVRETITKVFKESLPDVTIDVGS